jgi:hypothetical protein
MALDMREIMAPYGGFFVFENPSCTILNMPLFPGYPSFPFVGVSSSPPFLELLKQISPASLEGFGGYHGLVIICPSTYHRVQLVDKLFLGYMAVFPHDFSPFRSMAFLCFFTRFTDGLEPQCTLMEFSWDGPGIASRSIPGNQTLSFLDILGVYV